MMRYLVTGGGGFLGRHIVDQLLQRGQDVSVLGRREYPDLARCGVRTIQGGVEDKDGLLEACKGVDAVFHVAAKTGISGRHADYVQTNITGTRNVLAACKVCGVGRLVYTSTPSVVYGREPIENGNEDLPYPAHFLTSYAQTKAEAERLVLAANGGGNLYTCALRPHLIWGPGDTNLVPRIIARAKSGRLRRVGNGDNLVSVSYVENSARAHLLACDRLERSSPVCGRPYFINEPEPVNCWDFITRILHTAGVTPPQKSLSLGAACRIGAVLEIIGSLFPAWEPPMTRFLALQLGTSHYFSIARAQADLGWQPEISLDEGLRRLSTAHRK